MNENGDLDLTNLETTFSDSTKIISITHVSNVLGTINPINQIAKIANEIGAIFIVDGAQGVPHQSVNVKNWDVIFMCSQVIKCWPQPALEYYGVDRKVRRHGPIHGRR